MTTVYLARHGESDWNAANRFQGHSDRPLTELGRQQAEALAEALAATGGARRHLLEPAAPRVRHRSRGRRPPRARSGRPSPDLREVDVGSWTGLSRAEVQERFPDAFARWLDGGEGWADGETYAAMSDRVLAALLQIAAAHPGRPVLVVSHGGPIRAIHAAAAGIDVHAFRRLHRVEPNARLSRVAVESGEISRLD